MRELANFPTSTSAAFRRAVLPRWIHCRRVDDEDDDDGIKADFTTSQILQIPRLPRRAVGRCCMAFRVGKSPQSVGGRLSLGKSSETVGEGELCQVSVAENVSRLRTRTCARSCLLRTFGGWESREFRWITEIINNVARVKVDFPQRFLLRSSSKCSSDITPHRSS